MTPIDSFTLMLEYLDIILLIPLIWGAFIGFKKGLVLELASLVGLILGIYGALKFSSYTAEEISNHVDLDPEWLGMASFIVTFLIIVFAVFMLAKIIDKALKIVALGLINRILGLLFGLAKYTLILSCLLFLFENINSKFHLVDESIKEDSYLYEPIQMATSPFNNFLKDISFSSYDDLIKEESSPE